MKRLAHPMVAIALLAAHPSTVVSEEPREVPRVRVYAPAVQGKPEKGDGKVEVITVPRTALTRLEVSRSRSRKGKGALIGALVGVGASVAMGLAAGEDCSNPPRGDDLVSRLERNPLQRGQGTGSHAT